MNPNTLAERAPVRVLHVITGLGTGGAEMMLLKLCSTLPRDRFSTHVLTLSGLNRLSQRFHDVAVPVESLQMQSISRCAAAPVRLAHRIRQLRPHIIHGWMTHGNLAALAASATNLRRTPVLWSVQQSLDLEHARDARLTTASAIRVGAMLSSWPRAIVYNSRRGLQHHEAIGYDARRSVMIPNGFELDRFAPDESARASLRAELGLANDVLLVALIARYHPMKDHLTFLRAAAQITAQRSDVRFVLAGHRVDRANHEMTGWIRDLAIDDYVFLLGERSDIPRITAALDVAVSASRTLEGFSGTIGEAMSCGIPCVATNVGDAQYLVGDTGPVVAPGDPAIVSNEILRLLDMHPDERRRIGAAARARIEQHFSLQAVTQQYQDLYDEVLNAQP